MHVHLEHESGETAGSAWCLSDPSAAAQVTDTLITTRDEEAVTCPDCVKHLQWLDIASGSRRVPSASRPFSEGLRKYLELEKQWSNLLFTERIYGLVADGRLVEALVNEMDEIWMTLTPNERLGLNSRV